MFEVIYRIGRMSPECIWVGIYEKKTHYWINNIFVDYGKIEKIGGHTLCLVDKDGNIIVIIPKCNTIMLPDVEKEFGHLLLEE